MINTQKYSMVRKRLILILVFLISCVGPSSSSSSSSSSGRQQAVCILGCGNFFAYSEQNLSTPNKICALWLRYLVFVHLVFVHFLLLYSTTAVCVHFHFWQKIKSKIQNKKIIFCCCSTPLLLLCVHKVGTDGQTDGRTINPAWIPVENYWEIIGPGSQQKTTGK